MKVNQAGGIPKYFGQLKDDIESSYDKKKGNKFDAILKYEKTPDNDYFSWKMEFDK